MRRILVVIDMQNDFIDGSLGTPEAVDIVNNLRVTTEMMYTPPGTPTRSTTWRPRRDRTCR